MPLEYYLALLQLDVAVVGVIIAGVAALVQLLHDAKPRRDVRLLAKSWVLVLYGVFLAGVLLLLAVGSWTAAFPAQAAADFGPGIVSFFGNSIVGLLIIVLMLASLIWFGELALQARTLLDSKRYLRAYVRHLPIGSVHAYLKEIYDEDDDRLDFDAVDPFQPIREYVKDNAFKYYDYGTADGLKHFSNLFDRALGSSRSRSNQPEYVRLARYISDSSEEFFRVFKKTASEKRKMDTIELLYSKGAMLLQGEHDVAHASLMPIVHGLELIAKISDDDDEIILCLDRIRQMCDIFLAGHKTNDWDHIAGLFDEICLSVTRITETYYLHKNNSLKTVPIVGYSTGNHQTVTTALVEFFSTYRDLGDRHTDATPLYYFEAIEGVIEVLFVRLGDIVENGQQNVGFNMKYHDLAHDLYKIYYEFGQDAIQHNKPELLALSLSNLRQILKPAQNFHLKEALQDLSNMIVELTAQGIAEFGDRPIKTDEPKLSDYTIHALLGNVTKKQISATVSSLKLPEKAEANDEVKKFLKRLKTQVHSA